MGYYKKVYSEGSWKSVPRGTASTSGKFSSAYGYNLECRTTVDASEVNRLLSELNMSSPEAKKAIKSALRKSISIIQREAKRNFPNINKANEFKRDINVVVYRNASGARVSLMTRKPKYKDWWMLKFFDSGTAERQPKKGRDKLGRSTHNYGSIKPTYFFKNAVEGKRKESEESLQQNIIDKIKQVASKRK